MKDTLLGLVMTAVLVIVIGAEINFGFKAFSNQQTLMQMVDLMLDSEDINNKMSYVDLFNLDEMDDPINGGHVIKVNDKKVKINGYIQSLESVSSNYVNFIDDVGQEATLSWMEDTKDQDKFLQAYSNYFAGSDELLDFAQTPVIDDNVSYYQQTTSAGVYPVIYDDAHKVYCMFIPERESHLTIECTEPFTICDEMLTVLYPTAGDDPMPAHVFSTFELGAIVNTRKSLMGEDFTGGTSLFNERAQGTVYMSDEDVATRDKLATYNQYRWYVDGSSPDTDTKIDMTSALAKSSEWSFTNTPYTFQAAGLSLNSLAARKGTTSLHIEGVLTNTADGTRPYVLVLKFLKGGNNLLGLVVIDSRNTLLQPNESKSFSKDIDAESTNIKVSEIESIQFEMH